MTFQCVAEIFLQYLRLYSRKKSFYGDFNPDICTQTCDDDRLIKFFYKQKKFQGTNSIWCTSFYLLLFHLFSNNLQNINYTPQQDSSWDRWSRRRARWPLDHYHHHCQLMYKFRLGTNGSWKFLQLDCSSLHPYQPGHAIFNISYKHRASGKRAVYWS